jgi:hypothetical protein
VLVGFFWADLLEFHEVMDASAAPRFGPSFTKEEEYQSVQDLKILIFLLTKSNTQGF